MASYSAQPDSFHGYAFGQAHAPGGCDDSWWTSERGGDAGHHRETSFLAFDLGKCVLSSFAVGSGIYLCAASEAEAEAEDCHAADGNGIAAAGGDGGEQNPILHEYQSRLEDSANACDGSVGKDLGLRLGAEGENGTGGGMEECAYPLR